MKRLFILFISLILIISLVGCKNKYHAKTVSIDEYELTQDFIDENRTYNAYYYEKIWDDNINEFVEDIVKDKVSPEERIIVIKDINEFEQAFTKFPEINLEKKMIILYGYTTPGTVEYKVIKSNLKNNVLTIEYGCVFPKKFIMNSTMPMTKWIVFITDRIEYENVNIIYGNKDYYI